MAAFCNGYAFPNLGRFQPSRLGDRSASGATRAVAATPSADLAYGHASALRPASAAIVSQPRLRLVSRQVFGPRQSSCRVTTEADQWEECMRRFLLVAGLFALAVGLLWIGQGTGTVPW